MPKYNAKRCHVIFEGVEDSHQAVLDFSGYKRTDQESVLNALSLATEIEFKGIFEKGRQIILEYVHTSTGTIMSFLRELLKGFGFTPVKEAIV